MSAPNGLTLWGMGTVRQLRPHWMLAELGLDYEYFPVHPRSGETKTAEFLRINPRHKVPVLRHGTMVITESAAIIEYLGDAFPVPAGVYVPRDPAGRARLNEWCYFIVSELDATSLYIVRRHGGLKHIYGEAPVAVEGAKDYFREQLGAVDDRIGATLVPEGFSIADILMVTCLDWAADERIPLPPNAAAYHAGMKQRPAYQAACAKAYQKS
ncbi:MAG: glutathione S-transferase family protein [Betaproteobacteria bacterium]|nr:glutathione S-transferase family protein [Betaproteobacteria bacterium]